MVKGAVPGAKGGWVLLRDAVKRPVLPKTRRIRLLWLKAEAAPAEDVAEEPAEDVVEEAAAEAPVEAPAEEAATDAPAEEAAADEAPAEEAAEDKKDGE